jgi:ABC-2 type transport system permease protein
MNKYNQLRAMLAIARGSFKGMLRNPSAVAFGFGFPLVIILVFGSIGGGGSKVSVALKQQKDTADWVIQGLLKTTLVTLSDDGNDPATIRKDLERGRIAAILSIDTATTSAGIPQHIVHTQTSSASGDKYPILQMALARVFQTAVERNMPPQYKPIVIDQLPNLPGREYSMIDFIIPGMLGFSLLGSAVFGVAFLFFALRQQLVLKRYYATPIGKPYIILGEALARVVFQMITAVVIIAIGKFFFHFTLVNGWITFWELMFLSLIGLIVFMGFGFIISSVARSESTIPPFANLITLPQMLLGGTFFSTDVFPKWLQRVIEIMPLKQLNDAMRNVSFEGAHLVDCWKQMGILAIWGVVTYAVAVKVFKWE